MKTAWGKLRNCYFNAQKRRKTKSGQGATKVLKWKYEKEMEFLLPYLETRQTHTNLEQLTEELNDGLEADEEDHEATAEPQEEHESSVNNPPSVTSFQPDLKKPLPRRNQTSNPAQEMVKIMKENAELRKAKYQNVSKSADQSMLDETDMFYLSMAKTVKRLPPIEQATIRMQLCTMISEAEIRHTKQGQLHVPTPLTSPSTTTSSGQTFFSPPNTPTSQNSYAPVAARENGENLQPIRDFTEVPMLYTFQQGPSTTSYYSTFSRSLDSSE